MDKAPNKYSEEILSLIDNADDITRGDLQGVTEALVCQIWQDGFDAASKSEIAR